MNDQSEDKPIEHFLFNRLNLNGFKLFLLLLWYLVALYLWMKVVGISNYFAGTGYLVDVIIISVFVASFLFHKYVPSKFHELISQSRTIFRSDQDYSNFKEYIQKLYKSKFINIFSVFGGILYTGGVLFSGLKTMWYETQVGGIMISVEGSQRYMLIVSNILASAELGFLIFGAISMVLIEIATFRAVNKMGTEGFRLQVSYDELKLPRFPT